MIIEGQVAPGFEPVRALFEERMQKLAERNAQLCVYVGAKRVVDLWGSAIDDTTFTADSLANVFSSGKSLEAIVLARLFEQGRFAYDDRITDHWPEFAGGDSSTTIADLMRHEAGLAAFDTSIDPADLHAERLRDNRVGAIIERQTQRFPGAATPEDSNRREYHAITRGWIANELFRRIDPEGRTIGQYLRTELSEPFELDCYVGLKEEELTRVSKVAMLGLGYQLAQSFVPRALGRRTDLSFAQGTAKLFRLSKGMRRRTTGRAPAPMAGFKRIVDFDLPVVSMGETPSAGAKCSARGLAKLAAFMANHGSLGDTQLLGESAWAAMHDAPVHRPMMALSTAFTQGGVAEFSMKGVQAESFGRALNMGREGYIGWMGLGGSIFQWHPKHKIGFGYVPTSLNVLDMLNERGKVYQAEVLRCIEA